MAKNRKTPDMNLPMWFDGQNINEALFCEEFLQERRIIFANGAFFTPDGRVTDDLPLRGEIYDKLKFCAVNNIPRKITNILEVLKLEAQVPDYPPEQDRIHLSNGTLLLNGTFTEGRPAIVRSRLPVAYNPDATAPVIWLNFLDGLLYVEDIPTLQEFIGYCLIPSNKGQRMMVIKGNGGEGKSQIGAVLSTIFGTNMKDGSIGKISENRFARADLEHILLCVDDDMRMEALRQTNYVKSIVTAQGKMDLERKGKQSYQGWMFARLLAFSNGGLQALYDRSDGFYRRQLVLTTKEKQVDRADDPDLAEKMKAEAEGIFLWAFEGLQRLVANNFKFTESDRIRENREAVKRDNNNIFDFMDSEGYIRRKADASRGVFHQIVFQVHHRPRAADEQDGVPVVQPAYLVRRQQLPPVDLHVGGPGAGLALGFPVGLGVDGGFAEGLGDVLVGAGLVAAEVQQGVRVAGDGFPGVLVQLLDLGHVLNDGAGGNVAGTHGGQFTSVPWQRHGRELIQYKVDVLGKRPMMDLVCAVIKRLKRLGIEQGHQEIEGVVIVRDHGVKSAFLFSQSIEVHIVVIRDGPDLG